MDRGWIAWIADRQALPQISRQLTWRELRVNLTQGRSQRGYGIQWGYGIHKSGISMDIPFIPLIWVCQWGILPSYGHLTRKMMIHHRIWGTLFSDKATPRNLVLTIRKNLI
jgi:hypothetical protein